MENGNPPKKKSKKKKIRSNSPQTSNGSEKVIESACTISKQFLCILMFWNVIQAGFCGFSSRSVRNICEQVDNTEIQPEVYSRLAEDATYKIMEVVQVSE